MDRDIAILSTSWYIKSLDVTEHRHPTSGDIHFQLDLENGALTFVEVLTSTGQLLRSIPIASLPAGRNNFTLPGHDLPAGIYHVRISLGDTISTRKVVKM